MFGAVFTFTDITDALYEVLEMYTSCVCFPELWFEKTQGPFSYVFADM